MGTDICLPVSKYSYATGVRENNSIPWTHISSSNLYVLVKGTDRQIRNEELMLRIVQANDVLEILDVANYIDNAVKARRSAEGSGGSLYMDQLPIFGITRDALLALRYTLHDGQSRRLQMRMHSATDCRRLVHAFESRGMELTERRLGTAHPDTGRPATTSSRLLAPHPSSPYSASARPNVRHPFAPHAPRAGSVSQPHLASPERSTTEVVEIPFESSTQFHKTPQPKIFTRDESLALRELAATRPPTAQTYRCFTTPSQSSQYDAYDIVHQAHKSGLARPSSSSNTAGAEAIDQSVEHYKSPPASSAWNEQSSLPSASNLTDAISTDAMTLATKTSSPSGHCPVATRPSLASLATASLAFPQTLEHEIPPRRELPFPRPDSTRSGSEVLLSRPRSALTLPPLPKPKLFPPHSGSSGLQMAPPTRPASSARPQSSSPLRRSHEDVDKQTTNFDRSTTASSSPTKVSPLRAVSPNVPAKFQSSMEELLHKRKASLETSSATKVQRASSLMDAPHEEEEYSQSREPSHTRSAFRHSSTLSARQAGIERDPTFGAHAAIASPSEPNQDRSLERYAEQSLQDRQAALDEFMVQNLENPAFTTLCEDVENCWRRIALGL